MKEPPGSPPEEGAGQHQSAGTPVTESTQLTITEALPVVNSPNFEIFCCDCGKPVTDEGGRHGKGRWLCHGCASPDPARQVEALRAIEDILARLWPDPVPCGAVLTTVRNSKIFKAEYPSFRRWIYDRMPCSRSYVYRLMAMAAPFMGGAR